MARGKHGSAYQFAERCMYEYKDNLARLDSLKRDLQTLERSLSVHGQSYDAIGGHSSEISDPVGRRVEQIDMVQEEIASLERVTEPLTTLIKDLQEPDIMPNSSKAGLAHILKQYYFHGNIWQDVAAKLGIGRSMFFEKKRDLVKRAMWVLGV